MSKLLKGQPQLPLQLAGGKLKTERKKQNNKNVKIMQVS